MTHASAYRTLAIVLLSLLPAPAFALNDRAADVFQEARESIERGDCEEAVLLLESVKGRRTRERAFAELLEKARTCASAARPEQEGK